MTGKQPLYIVKIGGNIIDDEAALPAFLQRFAAIEGNKILVHGGGKLATRMAEKMGIPQQMVEGRRITDAETLKIVTMVYAGYINKQVVAGLQAEGCNAIGLSGADGNVILSHKRMKAGLDYGFAGDVDAVEGKLIEHLLEQELTPVLSPITHDGRGQLLNTNADTIAQETARAMAAAYDVVLIYSFEKAGVMSNLDDETSVISRIDRSSFRALKQNGIISAGMVPKLDNAFAALDSGVTRVVIGNAEKLAELVEGRTGTNIVHE